MAMSKIVIIILLSLFYLINTKIYIQIYSKMLPPKRSSITIILWLIFWAIITSKQFSTLILHNQLFTSAMSIIMILFQFVAVFLFYNGTIKKKIIAVCVPLTVSIFLDVMAVVISSMFLNVTTEHISNLTIGCVISTGLDSLLTVTFYAIYITIRSKTASSPNYAEAFIMSLINLVIIIPNLVIFNSILITKTSLLAITLIQFIIILLFIILCYRILNKKKITEFNYTVLQKEHEYYNSIGETVQELHKLRHDMNNHFASITALMNLGEYETAKDYLNKICNDVQDTKDISLLNDKLLSIILTDKFRKAKSLGIQTYKSIMVSEYFYEFLGQMQDTDKTALFTNILDNAIRAATESETKKINFEVKASDCEIIITCSNSKPEGQLHENRKGLFKTTKKEPGHGLGMGIINDTAWKYGGMIDYRVLNSMFVLEVSFSK